MTFNVQTATADNGAVVVSQGEQGSGAFTHRYSGPDDSMRWIQFVEGGVTQNGQWLVARLNTGHGELRLSAPDSALRQVLLITDQCDVAGQAVVNRPPYSQVLRVEPDQLFAAPDVANNLTFTDIRAEEGALQLELICDSYLVDVNQPETPLFRIGTRICASCEGIDQLLTSSFINPCFADEQSPIELTANQANALNHHRKARQAASEPVASAAPAPATETPASELTAAAVPALKQESNPAPAAPPAPSQPAAAPQCTRRWPRLGESRAVLCEKLRGQHHRNNFNVFRTMPPARITRLTTFGKRSAV